MHIFEINLKYNNIKEWIKTIPSIFESEGDILTEGRNMIKVFDAPTGVRVNVKRFCPPKHINKYVYSFGIRKPKGERAYLYAEKLLANNFITPERIAYIEERKNGIILYSYFISLQLDYQHRMYEWGDAKEGTYENFAIAFANYTAKLHDSQILHLDYSPGNILWNEKNSNYEFALVDINRMAFKKVSITDGCKSFSRLWGPKRFFVIIAKQYAKERNFDEQECIDLILKYRKRFWTSYSKRKPHKIKYKLEL